MTGHEYCVGLTSGLALLTFVVWQWRESQWRRALHECDLEWSKLCQKNTEESRALLMAILSKHERT